MADRFDIADIPAALEAKRFPTITLWNRVEGRPRTVDFQRALRSEVRDALWMVTRQWQVGEFNGEDAGSPVFAKAHVATTRLTRFQAGDASPADFDEALPLEARVEQLPLETALAGHVGALDLRLVTGRRWLKLIAGIGSYATLFAARYRIRPPDPTQAADAAVCAHPEVWQSFAALADRAVDGLALYRYLVGSASAHAYDGVAVLGVHKPALDAAAGRFVAWVEGLMLQPDAARNPAWQPEHLEYRFACSAPLAAGEKHYVADEYCQGVLDWHSVDTASGASLGSAAVPDPRSTITRTMIPVPVRYAGMPNPRWWSIEDGRTNFGDIRPDTTDLAKLLFIEYGLVYSNDWFLVPLTLPGGSVADVEGLVVTNVFGERFWIEAAGRGADADWQRRWSMFTVSAHRQPGAAADTGLLVLPTVPKVHESAPLEHIALVRDEMANMVWAIEKVIPGADGRGRSGASAARETRAYFERLVAAAGSAPPPALIENGAAIRYDVMSTVPEHWIPFIPVRADGTQRPIALQRGALTRIIEGDPNPPVAVQPQTGLMRVGLDAAGYRPYIVAEEEVPRAGTQVRLSFRRTRWLDGKVVVWLGARKETGRGEGSSGLAFDRLDPISKG